MKSYKVLTKKEDLHMLEYTEAAEAGCGMAAVSMKEEEVTVQKRVTAKALNSYSKSINDRMAGNEKVHSGDVPERRCRRLEASSTEAGWKCLREPIR